MKIRRQIIKQLLYWKEKAERKPLILQGSRQTGKTWLLKHFGSEYFENVAYFNFDQQIELKQFFINTRDPVRILNSLTLINRKPIKPRSTLIIFDEIQECSEALNSLKYFYEEAPEYFIACAGSLLGVAMNRESSFPVGKVEFMHLGPITFSEFLAEADSLLFSYLDKIESIEPIPDIFFNPLKEKLKMYFISGGMPEAIVSLLEKKDIELTQNILQNILASYRLDFLKHIDNKNIPKINYIWSSLPSQLARENKKFLYQAVRPGARSREYEDALVWLLNAGLIHKINCSTKPGVPITAYDDLTAFKIYMSDVGLLRRHALLDPVAITEGDRLFTEFKGALTENFVLESLSQQFECEPRYWRSGNMAEVDFLLQYKNSIIPVEVKSEENVRSKSLAIYRKEYDPTLCLRFSMKNLKQDGALINLPLFMADYTKRIIDLKK